MKHVHLKDVLLYAGLGFAGLFAYDAIRKHQLRSAGFFTGQWGALGQCATKTYALAASKLPSLITALQAGGASVAGSNPWVVDTNQYGVRLQGSYDVSSGTLTVNVTAKNLIVPCDKIWSTLDGYIASV